MGGLAYCSWFKINKRKPGGVIIPNCFLRSRAATIYAYMSLINIHLILVHEERILKPEGTVPTN